MEESGPHSLEGLRLAEDENYSIIVRSLGDTLQLVPDLAALYDWMAAELCKPGGAERCPEAVPGLSFLRASQYYLHSGALTCLRCHLTESFADTRMAIESVAVLALMKRKPEVAYLWMEAGINDDAGKKYRRETKGPAIFPAEDTNLTELKGHYDLCARQTHPGLVSMVRRLRLPAGKVPIFEFHWFDVRPESEAEPARTFLWIAETHLKVLEIYASIFMAAVEEKSWMLRRNALEASIILNVKKWMPKIIKEEGWYKSEPESE